MFDIGWSELLIIAVVTIIVVGPKDLPRLLRSLGQISRKVRATANEFRGHVDDVIRDAELDDLKSTMDDVKSMNPMNQVKKAITDEIDGVREIVEDPDIRNYHKDFPDDEPYEDFDDPGAEWDDEDDVIVTQTTKSDTKQAEIAKPDARSSEDPETATTEAAAKGASEDGIEDGSNDGPEDGPEVSWSDGETEVDAKQENTVQVAKKTTKKTAKKQTSSTKGRKKSAKKRPSRDHARKAS